jgi:hypothetical protein
MKTRRSAANRDSNALTRARAAYSLSRQDRISDAAVAALVNIIGDEAVVDRSASRDSRWRGDTPWTVGREADAGMRHGRCAQYSTITKRMSGRRHAGRSA